ncbi:MAG: DNA mismatch repair protein MutS [Simkaniaceae bacterium]|nr:DNA mismatch repair protein MutS [Simkaniaceae bacterium]
MVKTPMMEQWHACKAKAKEALVLFRLGDFYEAFYDDATKLSDTLELTLTQRHDVPMAGIPVQSLEGYLEKLINKGHLVAIAEQVEDAKQAKGLVKREIVRTVSPATHIDTTTLSESSNNFFCSLSQVNATFGLAMLDLSTGELFVSEVEKIQELVDELCKRRPKEILLGDKFHKTHHKFLETLKLQFPFRVENKPQYAFDWHSCHDYLTKHFNTHSLDGFGLKGMTSAITAAGALLSHIADTLTLPTSHIRKISPFCLDQFLSIDRASMRHLEILEPLHHENALSLLYLLDQTKTPMGARLFRAWLAHPLRSVKAITMRQDAVEELLSRGNLKHILENLGQVRDIERLIMRIEAEISGPQDLVMLRYSLEQVPKLSEHLGELTAHLFNLLKPALVDQSYLTHLIASALVDKPSDGNIFRRGFHAELDELYSLKEGGKSWLANYQTRLREELGIKTLKVNFNRAFGYFIEVSRGQADKMPEHFTKRQTLVNNERFISQELKEYEEKLYSAEDKISALETRLFTELRAEVARYSEAIRKIAQAVAQLDSIASLATIARRRDYKRPIVDDSDVMEIQGGRHPTLEVMQLDGEFIANDTDLGETKMMLITGPNMAGKSTYIRQVALLTIMAQIGSFIPADAARIGVVDRLFSRIGASDDLARGQSTFMVEMTETANILHNATERSLVILDEIGRGTSTYDGVSIAWAVAEFLLTHAKPKTLFATHYFELTDLEKKFNEAVNFQIAVDEGDEGIVFLHKIVRGGADRSYGIHVAKLAGLPLQAIETAQQMLASLEKGEKKTPSLDQLTLFPTADPAKKVTTRLKKIDPNQTTPLDALQELIELKKMLG